MTVPPVAPKSQSRPKDSPPTVRGKVAKEGKQEKTRKEAKEQRHAAGSNAQPMPSLVSSPDALDDEMPSDNDSTEDSHPPQNSNPVSAKEQAARDSGDNPPEMSAESVAEEDEVDVKPPQMDHPHKWPTFGFSRFNVIF